MNVMISQNTRVVKSIKNVEVVKPFTSSDIPLSFGLRVMSPLIGTRQLELKGGHFLRQDDTISKHCRSIPNLLNNSLRLLSDAYNIGKRQISSQLTTNGLLVLNDIKALQDNRSDWLSINASGDVRAFANLKHRVKYNGFDLPGGTIDGRIYFSKEYSGIATRIVDYTGLTENDILLASLMCGLANEEKILHRNIRIEFTRAFREFVQFVERIV